VDCNNAKILFADSVLLWPLFGLTLRVIHLVHQVTGHDGISRNRARDTAGSLHQRLPAAPEEE
jgi:hypothetical protein